MKIIRILISIILIARGLTGVFQYMSHDSTLTSFGKGQLFGFAAMIILGLLISLPILKKSKH